MKQTVCSRLRSDAQGKTLYLLSWLAYASAYIGRYNYSAVMGAITAENSLSLSAAGAVSTGYFICYAVGQIVFGLLSQSVSSYAMILIGLCGSGLCNLGAGAFSTSFMGLLWGANGLFQAMIWPPIVRLFAESMPLMRQKRACVSINSTTPAGTLAAYALSAVLLQFADWHHVFFSCGGLLLGMAAVFWLGTAPLRRATAYAPQPKFQKQKGAGNGPAALLAAGLGAMLLPVLLHGGLKDGVINWVPSMIQSNFGISPAFSAAVAMALPLVNLSGAYLSGWLNEHCTHNELKTAGSLFALASVCLLALPLAMRTSLLLAVLLSGGHDRLHAGREYHVHQRHPGQGGAPRRCLHVVRYAECRYLSRRSRSHMGDRRCCRGLRLERRVPALARHGNACFAGQCTAGRALGRISQIERRRHFLMGVP